MQVNSSFKIALPALLIGVIRLWISKSREYIFTD